MQKLQFTERQINIDNLRNTFDFEVAYTTSETESLIWLNISDTKNYATLGYQRNHSGYITHITKAEANNLINNL